MRIHVLSDLHLEFADWQPPKTDCDVVVLAGDISTGTKGLYWARDAFPGKRIVYVPGNHEFYGHHINSLLIEARSVAKELYIDLLDQDQLVIDGVRFLGATLWTDFRLFGMGLLGQAISWAGHAMADYKAIRTPLGWLTPAQTVTLHRTAAEWLEFKLRKEGFTGKTVVVTHHGPHMGSVAERYKKDLLTAAFSSDLSRLLGFSELWIHGHTHDSFDYTVEGTRVVCNPKGYPLKLRDGSAARENTAFNPGLVVEV